MEKGKIEVKRRKPGWKDLIIALVIVFMCWLWAAYVAEYRI